MTDTQVSQTSFNNPVKGELLEISNWNVHAIDPELKDENWGYNIFQSNKTQLRAAFGGYGYYMYDAQLIRQFARGDQPIERYKVLFDPQEKEAIYMGLNWNINSPIPKFRNIILSELNKLTSTVTASAVDELANTQRNNDKLKLRAEAIINEKLAALSKSAGLERPIRTDVASGVLDQTSQQVLQQFQVDLQNDDEFNIYFDSYYNQKVEQAEELAIGAVFDYNQFDELRKLMNEDVVDFGVMAHRSFIDNYTGLPMFQYMEPYNVFIQASKFKDYHDTNMWYYQPPATLYEVLQYFGNELSDDDVRAIWKQASKRLAYRWENYSWYYWDWRRWSYGNLKKVEVDLYYFEVRSPNCLTYEVSETKNGTLKMKRRKNDYEPPDDAKYNKQVKQYWAECVYSGYVVEGISRVFNWGLLRNMPREQGREQFTPFSLNLYRAADKGLTEMMIPDADNFEVAYLKMQHAIIQSKPRGYSFNWDALAAIDLGDGGKLTPQDLMKMWVQTGSTMHKTINEQGDPIMANANAPHMLLENGIDPSVEYYINIMNQCRENMAQTIGLNPAIDAQTPNPKLLVGVQEALQESSNNSRYNLISGVKRITVMAANYVSLMLSDIAKYNPDTWKKIKNMVGSENAAIIESLDSVPLHEFAITFNDDMNAEQRALFTQIVKDAAAKNQIDIGDVYNILTFKNLKQAIGLFNLKMRKQQQATAQMAQQQMQTQSQTEQGVAQIKILIEKMASQSAENVAQINAYAQIQKTSMENQKDIQKALLQFKQQLDKASVQKQSDSDLIEQQKNADLQTLHAQADRDMQLEKSKPKPEKKVA